MKYNDHQLSRTQSAFRTALQDEDFCKKHGLAPEEVTFEAKSLLYFVAGDPAVVENLSKKGVWIVQDATSFIF